MKLSTYFLAAAVLCAGTRLATAQTKPVDGTDKLPVISDRTKGMQKLDGLIPLYWQASNGTLFMEIGRFNHELLYQVSADLAITALLQPARAARLEQHAARDARSPDFSEVVREIIRATWRVRPPADGYGRAILREVQSLAATRLMDLAANADASPQVRSTATAGLRAIVAATRTAASAHAAGTREDIERFLQRPEAPQRRTPPLPTPAGEPIGGQIR